jgi:hypothetical protein
MSSDFEKMVKNLDDVRQITNALYTYGLAIDTHRYELFDQVFANEIEADYNPPGLLQDSRAGEVAHESIS